jgi:hypothetical protein
MSGCSIKTNSKCRTLQVKATSSSPWGRKRGGREEKRGGKAVFI